MLARYVRNDLGKMRGGEQFVTVFGMRAYNIGGKFGHQFVVHVVVRLIFRKAVGLFEFAHVVVVRRGARKLRVLADGDGARFRELRHDERVIERTRRLLFQARQERRVRTRQLAQAEHGETVEQRLEHGHEREREHRRNEAAHNAVPDRGDEADPVGVDLRHLQQRNDDRGGNGDDASREQ